MKKLPTFLTALSETFNIQSRIARRMPGSAPGSKPPMVLPTRSQAPGSGPTQQDKSTDQIRTPGSAPGSKPPMILRARSQAPGSGPTQQDKSTGQIRTPGSAPGSKPPMILHARSQAPGSRPRRVADPRSRVTEKSIDQIRMPGSGINAG
ncbi:hypothetical protein MMC07_002504 [Pseudocyphellaria aurata]|nr:hypothetical protein [Pseudocyphellaria aurata]